MGKSKSIQDQMKTNQDFQNYVQQISADMASRQENMASKLADMEKTHYASFPDKAVLMEGRYSHLTTTSEWSLKVVSNIINGCSQALFGSKEPEGSTKPETSQEVSASLQEIKTRELYIANQAFDVVQAIVGGFTNSTSTSVEQKLDGKPIAPGMIMFIGVENNAFSAQSFFKDEKIIQTIFVFKVCYSIKEGAAQSALSDLQAYEDQKATYRSSIAKLLNKLHDLDVTSDDYDEQEQKYSARLEEMNERLQKLNEKISSLQTNALKKDQAFCEDVRKMLATRTQNRLLGAISLVSKGFTCTAGTDVIMTEVRRNLPGYVQLTGIRATDYTGTHYQLYFRITDKNQYDTDCQIGRDINYHIEKALIGKGDFQFN